MTDVKVIRETELGMDHRLVVTDIRIGMLMRKGNKWYHRILVQKLQDKNMICLQRKAS